MKVMNISGTKSEKIIISAVFVLLTAVYVSLIWNNNVWMDEAFTASLVHTDFAGVISRSMADTLPPLYNIILKIMTSVFGYNIPVMKLASVIPMVLTLFAGARTVRKRFGFMTALLFMIFLTFMPLMLY
ncbi:MAG: glycosyltransferase family 39 protein, partial [Lachnospiraceae bacterium]|nr:glycosyltransferase family 39 protein [Lachnospiraceae bacterium]